MRREIYPTIAEIVSLSKTKREALGVLNRNRVDAHFSYSGFTRVHAPLSIVSENALKKAREPNFRIDREEQYSRIGEDFLGLEDKKLKYAFSTGTAIEVLLQFATEVGETIVMPKPGYPLEIFAPLAGGPRDIRGMGLKEFRDTFRVGRELLHTTVVLEAPRDPSFIRLDPRVFELLNQVKTKHVVVDRVNGFYDKEIRVERIGNQNRLYLRADPVPGSIGVIGFSKLLPQDWFGDLSVVSMNDTTLAQLGYGYELFMKRLSNRTPSNAAVFALAETLHDPYFPEFIRELKELADVNSRYVRNTFKDITQVEFDGPNVFIFLTPDTYDAIREHGTITFLKKYGVDALQTDEFMERHGVYPIALRLNVVKDMEDLEPITIALKEKIINIQRLITADKSYRSMVDKIPFENTNEEIIWH